MSACRNCLPPSSDQGPLVELGVPPTGDDRLLDVVLYDEERH